MLLYGMIAPVKLLDLTIPPAQSPWLATNQRSPDPQASLFIYLFSLTYTYVCTRVNFLLHRCDSVMPLPKHLTWFPTAFRPNVQTQHVCPEDAHIPLNLLLDFLSITLDTLNISKAWSSGVLDLCKPQQPAVMVGNMNQAIKSSNNHPTSHWRAQTTTAE